MALFDSGSSIGAAIAPLLVLFLLGHFGSWRPAFVIVGALGFLWLIVVAPQLPPAGAAPADLGAEREAILADHAAERQEQGRRRRTRPPTWRELLSLRQTWGVVTAARR